MPGTTDRPHLTGDQVEQRLILLTATRWFPVGIVFGLTVLLPLSRGLTLAQVGLLLSIQGFVVLGLELPTGGLADALGRRPLLLISGAIALLSTVLILFAETFWMFALGMVAQGIFRALDSGPLEAWYVDAAYAHDKKHPVERGLSRASMTLGVAIAVGAVIGGGLVAWHPFGEWSALALPFAVTTVLYATHTLLLAIMVREAPMTTVFSGRHVQMLDALQQTPKTIMLGLRLLRRSPALRALVLVEVFWSVAMIAFETLTPVQLAGDLGGEDAAAALFGPVSAAAWGLFAVGGLLAGITSKKIGVARTAIMSRILNGLFVIAMGVAAGPAGLIIGYWLTYLTHGSAGPMHSALLHREATKENRAVVLSMNSMIAGGSYSLGLLLLTPMAAATSPGIALVAAGAFSLIGALFYIPSRQRERESLPDRRSALPG